MSQKYIENIEGLSKLSQKIVRSHPDGYCGAVIDGPRGYGKTAFCMHTMREVYMYLDGTSRTDAWKKVLNNIFFSMNQVIDALKVVEEIDMDNVIQSQREFMIPVICWDDAGMHGGRLKHFVDMKIADKLNSVMDVARDSVSGFLMNAPEREGLLSFIRRYRDNFWVNITLNPNGSNQYQRLAVVRKRITMPDGRQRWRKFFTTKFNCYVDKWVYEEYKRMKIKAVQEGLRHLEKLAKNKE